MNILFSVNSISLRHYYNYISDTCTFTPSAVVVPQLFSLFHLLQSNQRLDEDEIEDSELEELIPTVALCLHTLTRSCSCHRTLLKLGIHLYLLDQDERMQSPDLIARGRCCVCTRAPIYEWNNHCKARVKLLGSASESICYSHNT